MSLALVAHLLAFTVFSVLFVAVGVLRAEIRDTRTTLKFISEQMALLAGEHRDLQQSIKKGAESLADIPESAKQPAAE